MRLKKINVLNSTYVDRSIQFLTNDAQQKMAEDHDADNGPGHTQENEVVSLKPSLAAGAGTSQTDGEAELTTSGETTQEDIPEAMKGERNM